MNLELHPAAVVLMLASIVCAMLMITVPSNPSWASFGVLCGLAWYLYYDGKYWMFYKVRPADILGMAGCLAAIVVNGLLEEWYISLAVFALLTVAIIRLGAGFLVIPPCIIAMFVNFVWGPLWTGLAAAAITIIMIFDKELANFKFGRQAALRS